MPPQWRRGRAPAMTFVGTVSGGTFHGPVLQGRDLTGQTSATLPCYLAPRLPGPEYMMTDAESAGTGNAISGGFLYGPVLQGRDIQASIQLPAPTPAALGNCPRVTTGFTGRDCCQRKAVSQTRAAAGPVRTQPETALSHSSCSI